MTATPHQVWSAEGYAENARFVSDLGNPVFDLLDPQPGERILDLGCGDGALTERIAAAGADVVGVDASASMLGAAAARGLTVMQVDGERLAFDAEFDAVFSNAALHWMPDAAAVAHGVRRALTSGGRFVAEMGGHGNVAAIITAVRAVAMRHGIDPAIAKPWYFPTPAAHAAVLDAAGFHVDDIALIGRPTPLPGALSAWVQTFRRPLFEALGEAAEDAAREIEDLLAPALRDETGTWVADYVRLRFRARAV